MRLIINVITKCNYTRGYLWTKLNVRVFVAKIINGLTIR